MVRWFSSDFFIAGKSTVIFRETIRPRNQTDQIGDVSTLAEPGVVDALVRGKQ
jgi:hypothetical protein